MLTPEVLGAQVELRDSAALRVSDGQMALYSYTAVQRRASDRGLRSYNSRASQHVYFSD
jgi:hypothetical protein